MFRAASDDDIEAYSDSVTYFIRKCIEDVVPTKIIRIYPNQKPWINSDVRSALSARTSAFKSGNTDDRKQASYDLRRSIKAAKRQYRNKVEEQFNTNNARHMWPATCVLRCWCWIVLGDGINNITGFKGNKPATVNIAASLPDELNTFYASFEADTTTQTESAPAAAAKEVSPLSLSVADVTRSFKRVNIRKAVGPDGIPGRVLKACAFQLPGVFTDIFNLSLSLSVVPACFKNTYVWMLFMDYSSAFNTIVPATLVTKLQTLGLNRSLCSWILNFLTGRSQVVRMGNNTSSPLTLNTGAPQGCVLSPLLYSLYTHDCTATHSSNVIVKFTDDTTVIGLITDNDETAYRERRWVPWLNGVRWTTSHSTSTRPRRRWWISEDRAEYTHPSTRHLWSGWAALSSSAFTSPRISHGLLTQMQTAEEVRNEPQHPQIILHLHCGEHPVAASPPGLETAPLATAKLCKGSCELPATLLEVSFPPSRISTPGGVQGKPGGLLRTPGTRPTDCSLCCPQGDVSAASDPALADWGIAFSLRLSG